MTRTTNLVSLLAAALVAVAATPSSAGATPSERYVPFVTDFPKASQQYVPFVSDFPRPAATPSPAPKADANGTDWSGATFEAGVGATLVAVLAGAGLVVARRRHAGPRLTDR